MCWEGGGVEFFTAGKRGLIYVGTSFEKYFLFALKGSSSDRPNKQLKKEPSPPPPIEVRWTQQFLFTKHSN